MSTEQLSLEFGYRGEEDSIPRRPSASWRALPRSSRCRSSASRLALCKLPEEVRLVEPPPSNGVGRVAKWELRERIKH